MSPIRNLVLGVLLALVALVGVLGSAAIALGATPTPQQRMDAQAAWMASVLHVPVPTRPVVVGGLQPDNVGEADADGVIRLAPAYANGSPGAVYARQHELDHRPGNAACWGEAGSAERALEEGLADAVAQDLMPAAMHRFAPQWWGFVLESGYEQEVRNVRYASAAATGRPWRSREARLWRRALWGADCDGRVAMLARVGAG